MHYYEFYFTPSEKLVADGWTVNEDGMLDQTFYAKTESELDSIESAKEHLRREFKRSSESSVDLVNCLDQSTVDMLCAFYEIEPYEFEIGCGIPA